MKRMLALVLTVFMLFSLVGCGEKQGDSDKRTDGADVTEELINNEAESNEGLETPDKIGFFDPEFDYSQYPTYKVVYMNAMNDAISMEYDATYAVWAEKMNIDYTPLWCPVSGSVDEFLSGIQTFADQGYDGIIVSPDVTVYERVIEVIEENNMKFFPSLGQARDYTGDNRLLAPSSGYDQDLNGQQTYLRLIQWLDETYPDADWDAGEVGYISVTWSIAPEVHRRTLVQEQLFAEQFPQFGEYDELMTVNPKHFFIADSSSGTGDQTTIQNLVTQIISANSGYKYWLIGSPVDYYSIGAANAVENLNMNDTCCVVSVGGMNMRENFDAGIQNSWRYSYTSAAALFTECPMAALWAIMSGNATFDTLWPEWVDPNDKGDVFDASGNLIEEHFYAKILLRSEWIDFNNYQNYMEWADLYLYGDGEKGLYDYDVQGVSIDDYEILDPLPEYSSAYNN